MSCAWAGFPAHPRDCCYSHTYTFKTGWAAAGTLESKALSIPNKIVLLAVKVNALINVLSICWILLGRTVFKAVRTETVVFRAAWSSAVVTVSLTFSAIGITSLIYNVGQVVGFISIKCIYADELYIHMRFKEWLQTDVLAAKKVNQDVIHYLQMAMADTSKDRSVARDYVQKAYSALQRSKHPSAPVLLAISNEIAEDPKRDHSQSIARVLTQLTAPGV
jgi:hypothetical protein